MKKSEFVSRIVNGLNSLSKDARISRRYILKVGQDIVRDFVSKNLSNGKLLRDLDLLTHIECLPMSKEEVIKCDIVEFRRCNKLLKSTCKLPELFGTDYGNSIVSVYSIDEMVELKPITLTQYRRNQNRNKIEGVLYYYEKNGYLYIPDADVLRVGVDILTLLPEEVLLNQCGCNPPEVECIDIYDTKFIVPSKFIDSVVKATIQEVAFKKQIPTDTNPNLNENQ